MRTVVLLLSVSSAMASCAGDAGAVDAAGDPDVPGDVSPDDVQRSDAAGPDGFDAVDATQSVDAPDVAISDAPADAIPDAPPSDAPPADAISDAPPADVDADAPRDAAADVFDVPAVDRPVVVSDVPAVDRPDVVSDVPAVDRPVVVSDVPAVDVGIDAGGTGASRVISYFGGAGVHAVDDQGRDVTVDAAGNFYVTGGLFNDTGAFFRGDATRHIYAGATRASEDVFVLKLGPDGSLIWATLIGGPSYDRPYAVEVDAAGNVWVAGRAGAGFPTTAGALQTAFAGDARPNGAYGQQDGFVARLRADGTLDWATYVGDAGPAFIRDIAVDPAGNAYLGMTLVATGFPYATAGSLGPTGAASDHAALVKLGPRGDRVVWGAHLGGTALTVTSGETPTVRLGPGGDVYVLYATLDARESVSATALQRALGGAEDVFVTRLTADGARTVFATYLGGAGNEATETHEMEIDASGRAVLSVPSTSTRIDTIVGAGAHQRTNAGATDWLIATVSADGSRVEAATFFGGSGIDHAEGIAIDPRGRIVLCGTTASTDGLLRGMPLPSGAPREGLLAVFTPDLGAGSLVYASRAGGSGNDDSFRAVAVARDGSIATTGLTNSTDLVTSNAVQRTFGGGPHDVWWMRIPAIP